MFVLIAILPKWQDTEAEISELFPTVSDLLESLSRMFKTLNKHMLLENLQLFRLTDTGKFKDGKFIALKMPWSEHTNFASFIFTVDRKIFCYFPDYT